MRNAADPVQVKEAEKKAKYGQERELSDFRFVMESAQGRRFIARMLDFCGFQKTSFTGNSETFYNEGKRAVALDLWLKINQAAPDLYFRMIEDAKGDENG